MLNIGSNIRRFSELRKETQIYHLFIKGEKTYDEERQFEIFSLDSDVTVGEHYFIEMNFTGPLTGDLTGLYLSQYQRGNETV